MKARRVQGVMLANAGVTRLMQRGLSATTVHLHAVMRGLDPRIQTPPLAWIRGRARV